MKKDTLLFIAYHQNKESVSESAVDKLRKLLIDIRVVRVIIDVTDYKNACKSIDNVLEQEHPDIIFAEGAACFYTHQLVGYNRICLNPQLMISSLVSPSEVEKFKELELKQFSYDRKKDKERHTYCFGLLSETCDEESKRKFLMMYYPNTIPVCETDETFSIRDAISVYVHGIKYSTSSENGVSFTDYGRTLLKADYVFFRGIEEYEIPSDVSSIEERAFFGMEELRKVTFPRNMRLLGQSAFESCIRLKEIELPLGLKTVPEYCFCGCSSLEKVKLPDTIYAIREKAFAGTSLKEVEIPDSVQYISPTAFDPGVKLSASASRIVEWMKSSIDSFIEKNIIGD